MVAAKRENTLTPQQKARRWIPPQQRFVAALAGWKVQRRHIFLRRAVFFAALAAGLAAWWPGGEWLAAAVPVWAGWFFSLSAVLVLIVSLTVKEEGKFSRTFCLFFFFLLAGAGAGLLAPKFSPAEQLLVALLVAAAPAGSAVNTLFFRRLPKSERQFLLLGPWLAAALAACYLRTLSPMAMAAGGAIGLFLAFAEIRTVANSLAVRTPAEFLASASDVPVFFLQSLLGFWRGE